MLRRFKNHYLEVSIAASTCILVAVFVAQYGYDLEPCILCVYQRMPYICILLFTVTALSFGGWDKSAVGVLFGLLFLLSACLAFFHFGVENGLWLSNECGGKKLLPQNLQTLHLSLGKTIVADCGQPTWTLLGCLLYTSPSPRDRG